MTALLIAVVFLASGSRATVVFAPEAVVRGPQVKLVDVATVQGSDARIVSVLSQLELGRAPLPGLTRVLPSSALVVAMRAAGLDPTCVQVSGASQVRVTGECQVVKPEAILSAAEAELRRVLQERAIDAEVRPRQAPNELVLPPGAVTLEADLPVFAGNGASVRVRVAVDGQKQTVVSTAFDVVITSPVLVATRNMDRGQVVQAEWVRLERRKGAGVPRNACSRPEDAVGQRLKTTVKQGDVITASMVEPVPLVEARKPVEVTCAYGSVRVTVKGQALEDGLLDQAVRVRLSQGRDVIGVVKGPGLVEVSAE
ncbi:MAG: flagellar basal body P-ring formation chaperone FlgA [Armatimonadota bacterium]